MGYCLATSDERAQVAGVGLGAALASEQGYSAVAGHFDGVAQLTGPHPTKASTSYRGHVRRQRTSELRDERLSLQVAAMAFARLNRLDHTAFELFTS